MKEGRNLIKQAVESAKTLQEAAIAAAKQQLIEEMSPFIRTLAEKAVCKTVESADRVNQCGEGEYSNKSHAKFEENKDSKLGEENMKPEKDAELDLEGFFPGLAEEISEEAEGEDKEEDKEEEKVEEAKACDGEGEEEVAESIEISEEQLKSVYENALKAAQIAEAQVSKGFADMTKGGELDEVDPAAGIADVKKGEHAWDGEEPPAKQDFTVKENVKRMIQLGLQENKALRKALKEAYNVVNHLRGTLHETNLFNSKILHVNKILNQHGRLTKEQRGIVLESIDKAKTIAEVKLTYEAISRSFTAVSNLSESRVRKPITNAQGARTSGAVSQKVISESNDNSQSNAFARWNKLAGLIK
jgi:hypothetical protein